MIVNLQEQGNKIKSSSLYSDIVLLDNGLFQDNPWGITAFDNNPTITDYSVGFQLIYSSTQTGTQTKTCTTDASIDWSKYKRIRITYFMGLENRSGFVGTADGYIKIGSSDIIHRNRTQSTGTFITEDIDISSFNSNETLSIAGALYKTNTYGVGGSVDVWVHKIELFVR